MNFIQLAAVLAVCGTVMGTTYIIMYDPPQPPPEVPAEHLETYRVNLFCDRDFVLGDKPRVEISGRGPIPLEREEMIIRIINQTNCRRG